MQQGQEVQQRQEEVEGLEVSNLPHLLLLRSASSAFQVVCSPSLESRL